MESLDIKSLDIKSLDMIQDIVNPYTGRAYALLTWYNPRRALYETVISFYMNDGSGHYITIPIQRYKMRKEAISGHNAWARTLRQEDFAVRNVDTAKLYIFTREGSII